MTPAKDAVIAVACGVLMADSGAVLIAQRPTDKIAAGLWEFPGGKIEAGESPRAALDRELHEELGIEVEAARPLMRLQHAYSSRTVLLDVWKVGAWRGEPHGREQQAFAWCRPEALTQYPLLAADAPIVRALQLPEQYVFSPPDATLAQLQSGISRLPSDALLRLRLPSLDDAAYREVAVRLADALRGTEVRLVLDRDASMAVELGAWGLHLSAARLYQPEALNTEGLKVIASAHHRRDLERAVQLGCDAAVLGNVGVTKTHPKAPPLGWTGFERETFGVPMPVYAIGGVGSADLPAAFSAYAQGVAGISAYWR
ncbi:Nudix family hydrolase [Sinimarinibacterium sp. CAU 1509]|uniref:Nudix family hydrolase n=1 Tax=Sinimarinibacterium sp. CAU 1509 TaxID=2562283 RepID=UPI0010AB5829|nr:Nudix family hydrolase [Sinimarinibacterium sp. CAU 1509]TJY65172.1 Nudix family hydrolase [Sinimarinibacterium sp. CAU 1509]